MSRTTQTIGNAKRQGTVQNAGMAATIGPNDETGSQDDVFWAIAGEAIVHGEVLVRQLTDLRIVGRSNASVGQLAYPCGVALTDALAGFPVKVMRRGIHAGVMMNAAGAAGNQMSLSTTSGKCDFNAFGLAVAKGLIVGIQMEAATGSPLKCSGWVNCDGP